MNKEEILKVRNIFSILGWEHTPDQVNNDFGKELRRAKEEFLKIKFHIVDLAIKFNLKEITLEDVAKEV